MYSACINKKQIFFVTMPPNSWKFWFLVLVLNERTKESFWYFSCFMTQPYSQIVIGAGLIFFVPNVQLSNFVTGSLHCFVSVLIFVWVFMNYFLLKNPPKKMYINFTLLMYILAIETSGIIETRWFFCFFLK